MTAGDLVILTADPLRLGGELLVLEAFDDGRLLCEAVHFTQETEDDAPPRGIFFPDSLELASVWARQPA